jgi:hypothetical protein
MPKKEDDKNLDICYAIGCTMTEEASNFEDIFLVKFNTKDEHEALQLVSCIVGAEVAHKHLVVIMDGDIFDI